MEIRCFVCHAPRAPYLVKVPGVSKSKPRHKRPVCEIHAGQATQAGYKIVSVEGEEGSHDPLG